MASAVKTTETRWCKATPAHLDAALRNWGIVAPGRFLDEVLGGCAEGFELKSYGLEVELRRGPGGSPRVYLTRPRPGVAS